MFPCKISKGREQVSKNQGLAPQAGLSLYSETPHPGTSCILCKTQSPLFHKVLKGGHILQSDLRLLGGRQMKDCYQKLTDDSNVYMEMQNSLDNLEEKGES